MGSLTANSATTS